MILLDAGPEVVGMASQAFGLHWHDGRRKQRHAPDYFVRLADGRGRVVNIRAGDRIDEAAAESFAATERARGSGLGVRPCGAADPVLMANMR
ncbi:MAG: hypothetical protein QOF84_6449 [Streptomyces sp.]|nr:hypothetical protein [Streptomyces sp.]